MEYTDLHDDILPLFVSQDFDSWSSVHDFTKHAVARELGLDATRDDFKEQLSERLKKEIVATLFDLMSPLDAIKRQGLLSILMATEFLSSIGEKFPEQPEGQIISTQPVEILAIPLQVSDLLCDIKRGVIEYADDDKKPSERLPALTQVCGSVVELTEVAPATTFEAILSYVGLRDISMRPEKYSVLLGSIKAALCFGDGEAAKIHIGDNPHL